MNRKRMLLTLAGAFTVASIAGAGVSLAVFTDTEDAPGTFTAGTIILDATKIAALSLTNTSLAPGESVTGSVDVENIGTSQLRYSLDTSSTDVSPNGAPLYTALTIDVKTVDVNAADGKCDQFDGTPLNGAAEILDSPNVMFGDVSPTIGTGDRTVNAGSTDVLCIRVSLPIATDVTFQDASSVTTFLFDAEQTANN